MNHLHSTKMEQCSGSASLSALSNSHRTKQQLNNGNIYNSFRSNKSTGREQSVSSLNPAPITKQWKKVNAQFHVKYAGGESMREGFCRHCTISLHLEQLPSVQISNWDVLSAEM